MIFKFIIISDERPDFRREILIKSDASFYDLHKIIVKSTGFDEDEPSSFFICEDDWRRREEITLYDMGKSSDEDSYIMDETLLDEMLEEEHQKLTYVFDYLSDRAFYIELSEIVTGKTLVDPVCALKRGNAPKQKTTLEDLEHYNDTSSVSVDSLLFGDTEYDIDELDKSGFDGLEEIEAESED